MIKLMHKKLNKKGFTLAELLVVIAILAILIAIAVPVFTHMVAEANLRVNQANVHSVRSAAVAHILTHMGDHDDTGDGTVGVPLNSQVGVPDSGWVATATVDNNGNIDDLKVYVVGDQISAAGGYSYTMGAKVKISTLKEGIGEKKWTENKRFYDASDSESTGFYEIKDTVDSAFATVKPSMGVNKSSSDSTKVYFVQAIVKDLKDD